MRIIVMSTKQNPVICVGTHPKLIDHFFFVDFEFGAGVQMEENGILCLTQLLLTKIL